MFLGHRMESSSLDSTVSSLTMDDDVHIPHQFSSITKLHNDGPGTTSVHELLECLVCTSSMYPPIHQARNIQWNNSSVTNSKKRDDAELQMHQGHGIWVQLQSTLHSHSLGHQN
ncbi:hypothetical protein K1719_032461 [Acacia pycnantha]|nr:hypothetical protein K1719_032461 [Acacia pycnantha]